MTRLDLLVRGGAVVTPNRVSVADVAVSDGEIVEISPEITGTAPPVSRSFNLTKPALG